MSEEKLFWATGALLAAGATSCGASFGFVICGLKAGTENGADEGTPEGTGLNFGALFRIEFGFGCGAGLLIAVFAFCMGCTFDVFFALAAFAELNKTKVFIYFVKIFEEDFY